MKNNTLNKPIDAHDELKFLYELCLNDITYTKNQQWKITNYIVLIYVALFGVWNSGNSHSFMCYGLCLSAVGLIILIFGIILLSYDQKYLKKSRRRIDDVIKHFSYEFITILNHNPDSRNQQAMIIFTTQIAIATLSYGIFLLAILKA